MIASEDALDNALDEVGRLDPVLASLRAAVGRPRLRKREPGFAGLVGIILGQQVSTASAAAIVSRVEAHFGLPTPDRFARATDEEFRACGLSRPKVRTVRAAAAAVLSGACPLDELDAWPAERAHEALVTIPGIGPWTADIYLLFCIGHPDAFPAGDLALQEAVRLGYGLENRPSAADLAGFAQRWRPWRGAAATLLWGYYALRKGRAVVDREPVTGAIDGSARAGQGDGSSGTPARHRRRNS